VNERHQNRWQHGGLAELLITDAEVFEVVMPQIWALTCKALQAVRFQWLEQPDDANAARQDVVRRANLLQWRPNDSVVVLSTETVGADELVHLALHHRLFETLGAAEDWHSWLLCEAVASAADVWLLGAMVGSGQQADFVDLQAEVWSQCWLDAARPERSLHDAFERCASAPTEAMCELIEELEGFVGSQRASMAIATAADQHLYALNKPWGPLLLHYQVDWWALVLRGHPEPCPTQAQRVQRVRDEIMASESPIEHVLR